MKAIHTGLVGFCFLFPLVASCFGADTERFKSLFNSHRWFELRDTVKKTNAPLFYQGAVACTFNRVSECERLLARVIKSQANSAKKIEAHKLLVSAYLRRGEYREALAHLDALRALDATNSELGDSIPLLETLRNTQDQEIVSNGSSKLQLRDAGLPIQINGIQATYWFDTGADTSCIKESEAKRFGLRVSELPIKVGGVTGAETESRIAVANDVAIGPFRLRHVVFRVFADDQPPFNQSPPGQGGLIGIPVLLALQRFGWNSQDQFEIDPSLPKKQVPHAELCFDGNHPVVQVVYDNRRLSFTLDTGATNTDLYLPFAKEFPRRVNARTKTDAYKMEGVGGTQTMQAAVLPSLRFRIGGFPVELRSATVLLSYTLEASHFFYGNLGIDALQQAHKTTLDFRTMTLTLE